MARKKVSCPQHYYFPPELWDQILARLPARTLLRFRCVCRSWRSLIDDPDFINKHLTLFKHNQEGSQLVLLHENIHSPRYGIVRRRDTFKKVADLGTPPIQVDFVLGHVNGLLLMRAGYRQLVVWNLSVRKFIVVPRSPYELPMDTTSRLHSFGYDCSTNDYKVLAMTYSDSKDNREQFRVQVEVFSLRTGSWKRVVHDDKLKYLFKTFGMYFKGSIHWIACERSTFDGELLLLLFDVSTELFSCITNVPDKGSLCVVEGCLALRGHSFHDTDFAIWVMEKYCDTESWTKRYTIKCQDALKLLWLGEEILFVTKHGVSAYDFNNHKTRNLAKTRPRDICFSDTFVESLVLCGRSNVFSNLAEEATR